MAETLTVGRKLLSLDADDTMWGTFRPIWRLHKHIARTHYGINLDDATILEHWGKPIVQLAHYYYQTDNVELALERIVEAAPDFPKEPFDFTVPTLRHLKAAGMIIAIVSATTEQILANDAKHTGIPLELFSYKQTGEDTEYHKPDPRVFEPLLRWAGSLGIQESQILYVGDSLGDWRAAHNAGIGFIGVETGLVTAEQFSAEGAASVPNLGYLRNVPT